MKDILIKISIFFLLSLLCCVFATAQTFEFPDNIIGFNRIPEVENTKGIRTIIYSQQRGEKVFDNKTETFDKNGRKVEELSQNASIEIHSGSIVRLGSKVLYVYDSAGKLEKSLFFSTNGKMHSYEINKYDEDDLLIEQMVYNDKGEKRSETKYSRNSDKREVEVVSTRYYNGRAISDKNLLIFNDKGLCIKKIEYEKDGSIDSTTTFEYNEKGHISKHTKTYESFYGHTYEYKYDVKGNWIERQTSYFQSDKKGGIASNYDMSEYRIISYYDDEKTMPSNQTQKNKSEN